MKNKLFGVFVFAGASFVSFNALAHGSFSSNSTSAQGYGITFSVPLEAPVAGLTMGGLVCTKSHKAIAEANLWMDHADGKGHGGPKVTLRPISNQCAQINSINFPHAGKWQVQLKFEGGDTGVFEFDVAGSLDDGVFTATSSEGTFGTIQFEQFPLDTKTDSFLFCSNSLTPPKEAQLWMPDMGHGSSPTQITSHSEICSEVSAVDFFMPGNWEIRTELENGEKFAFALAIKD